MNRTSWVLLAMLVGVMVFRSGHRGGPPVNESAPQISASLLEGGSFNLSEHKGKVIVLDFWATWCPPCRASLPALGALSARYQGDPSVWIGSVNKERLSPQRLRRFLAEMNVQVPVILDRTGQVNARYQVSALPTMVMIGRDGLVSKTQVGLPYSDPKRLEGHLVELIEQAKRAP